MTRDASDGEARQEPPVPADLPPYVIEGARSSRSKCKSCRRPITQGTLRLGILIEGPYGTGYLWHHLTCAARRQFERVAEAYELEAWKEAKQPPADLPSLEQLERTREQSEQRRRERKPIPHAEPAPTGRARCKQCNEIIEQGSLRVVLGRRVEFGQQVRTTPINVHPRCVARALEAEDNGTEREGFALALRENTTGVEPERLEQALREIGDLG
jgi:hypothetical protein